MRIRAIAAVIGFSTLGSLSLGLIGQVSPDSQPQARLAPINPAYLHALESPARGSKSSLPSPQNIAHLQGLNPSPPQSFPTTYDLRRFYRVSPIRNQIPIASCTLFGVYASLESTLKPLETWDFSENHLDTSSFGGGFLEANLGVLTSWANPILEEEDPWLSPPNGMLIKAAKHVQKAVFLPPRAEALDNDRIKQAVIDLGAIYTEMYYVPALLNQTYAAYYNESTAENLQAVAIVGWDDDFAQAKFTSQPPGRGAFLCKNSFGSNFGNAGYFYVSYYDAFFGRFALNAVFTAEPAAGLTQNYQHDLFGCTARMGYGDETAWFANQFQAVSTDPLAAVSFYSYGLTGNYDIFVYLDSTPGLPRSGTLNAQITGSLDAPGYYTIPLPAPVSVLINQRFSVVIKLRTPGDDFPIPLEHPITGYNAPFQASINESFISADGAVWNDLTTYQGMSYTRSNVCVKALAGFSPIYPPAQLRVDRLVNNLVFFKEYVDRLTWLPNSNNSVVIAGYRIYRKEKGASNEAYEFLAEVGTQNLLYYVRGLKKESSYAYRVTAVTETGREGDPAEVID